MKYILIVAAVLVGIVLVVVITGWSLPVKHHVAREEVFVGTPQTLFGLITNIDDFPKWRSSVKRVEHLPDIAGKMRFREYGSNGAILYEVDENVPDRRLVTRIADRSLPFGGTWSYDVSPQGDSVRLRITEDGEVYNPVFRFVSRFVMGHTSTIDQFLSDVRGSFNR